MFNLIRRLPVLTLLLAGLLSMAADASSPVSLRPAWFKTLRIAEPSGICLTGDQHYFIASNNGVLVETDKDGKVLRKENLGMDIEDLCSVGHDLFILDESLRLVYCLDQESWKIKNTYCIPYNGARNKGYESIVYLPESRHFLLLTEKQPVMVVETDEHFVPLGQRTVEGFSDLSSATWFQGNLWFLSDEDRTVSRVNPADYTVQKQWKVPVYNPEGICFDADGSLRILKIGRAHV